MENSYRDKWLRLQSILIRRNERIRELKEINKELKRKNVLLKRTIKRRDTVNKDVSHLKIELHKEKIKYGKLEKYVAAVNKFFTERE